VEVPKRHNRVSSRAPKHAQPKARALTAAGPQRIGVVAGLLASLLIAVTLMSAVPHTVPRVDVTTPSFIQRLLGKSAPDLNNKILSSRAGSATLTSGGFTVRTGSGAISVNAVGQSDGTWNRYEHGATRGTPTGIETITASSKGAEESLVVGSYQGTHTWSWTLRTNGLVPRVGNDGAVGFLQGHRLIGTYIRPVAIYDAQGRNITPAGLRWSVVPQGGGWVLQLTLDDTNLPTPYVIDPGIALHGTPASYTSAGSSVATFVMNVPTGVALNDLLLAQVTFRSAAGLGLSAPVCGCWTLIRRDDVNTAGGSYLSQALYYHVATSSEPSTYTWTLGAGTQRATGGIIGYAGVNDSSPVDVHGGATDNTGASSTPTAPSVTTTVANDMLVGFFGIRSGDTFAPPGGMNEEWDTLSGGSPASEAADALQAAFGASGTKQATATGGAANWIAQLVALKPDVTPPSANTLSTTSTSPAGSSFVSGTTLYYRGTGGGSGGNFQLSDTVTDGESGPASATFPALGGITTGWTHTAQTVSTPAGGPYVTTNNYVWTEGTTSSPTDGITSTDNAGNTSATSTLTFVNDSTNPTGSITTPTSSSTVSGTIAVTSNSADSGSGVGSAQFQYAVHNGSTWTTIGTDNSAAGGWSVNWDTTQVAAGLYDLRVITTDNVGNNVTSALITSVNVQDITGPVNNLSLSSVSPAGSSFLSGTTVYYRGTGGGSGGNFQITNAPTDPGSGPASTTFPALGGVSTNWTHTNQTVNTPSGGPYTSTNPFTWTETASTSPTEPLQSADAIGNTTTTTLTMTNDSTAPTGSVTAPAASANIAGSAVTVSSNSADAGSGVRSATFEYRLSGSSGSWTAIGTDSSAAGGWSLTWDTTGVPDNLYDIHVVTTDNVNNTFTSAAITNVRVDNTAPTGSVTAPAASANVRGAAVTVSSNSADGGSGVATATFQRSPAGAGTWTTIGTDNSAAGGWSVTWDSTTVGDALYDLHVITTDNAGNATTSAAVTNVRVDNTNPTNVLTITSVSPAGSAFKNGNTIYYRGTGGGSGGNFQVQNATTDAGSGPASSTFPALGGTTTGWTHTNETISTPAGGPYVSTSAFTWSEGTSSGPTDLVTATDNSGNTNAGTTLTMVNDSTAPTGAITAPAANANLRGTVAFSSNSADAGGSGVLNATFQSSPSGLGSWSNVGVDTTNPYSVNWVTTSGSYPDGLYDLRVVTTDNVGNVTTSATITVRVDNTVPTNAISLSSVSPAGTAFLNGTTLYYKGNSASGGSFQMTNSVVDSGSGPASSVFPTLTNVPTGWTHTAETVTIPAGGPYTTTNNFSWSTGSSSSPHDAVTSTDNAGNTSAATTLIFTNDITNPTGNVTAPAASANVAGSAVTVTSNSADGGSGVGTATFQRSPAGAGTWTTIATDNSAAGGWSVTWDTTSVADGLYDLRVITTDVAGNATTSGAVSGVVVDNTNPTQVLSLASSTPVGAAFKNGNTVYYRGTGGGSGGSFQLTDTVSDSGSGPASATFPVLGGTTTGWTHSAQTVITPTGGPYTTTNNFAWTEGTSSSPTDGVSSADNAGNTSSTTTLTFTNDSTNPTGSITAPSANAIVSGSNVTVSSNSADAGSGVASATFQYAPHSTSSWTTIGSPVTTGPYSVTWNTTSGVADGLYDLRVVTTDNVGNVANSAVVANIRVDNTAPADALTVASASPAGAVYMNGNTVYYRGTGGGSGGSFQLTDTVSDSGSGPASANFPSLGGTSSGWSHALQTVSTPAAGPYTTTNNFAWTEGTPSAPTEAVTSTDNASNTSSGTTLTFTNDSTAPTGAITSPVASANVRGSIAVTSNSADADSGVASAKFQKWDGVSWTDIATDSSPAGGWSVNWDTTGVADGSYSVRVITTDNVGNQTTSSQVAVLIDNASPTDALSVTSVSPAGSVYKTGTTVYYRGTGIGGGSFQVTDTVSDAGSGPASATFPVLGGTTGGWSHGNETVTTPSGGPYTSTSAFAWTNGTSSTPTETVNSSDNAGNASTGTTLTFTNDSTAPTGSLTAPSASANVRGNSVTVSSNSADDGSGVASATFQYRTSPAGSWNTIGVPDSTNPYAVSWDTTSGVPDGVYDLQVITTDNVGNTFTSAVVTVTVDNTNPTGSITAPSNNANVRGASVSVTSNSADGGSGVASATLQYRTNPAGAWNTIGVPDTTTPYGVNWNTTSGVPDGLYDLQVITVDNAGNTFTSATITIRVDNTNPTGSISAPSANANVAGNSVNVASSSADGGSGVASARFQFADHGGSNWVDIGTDNSAAGGWSVTWDTTGVTEGLHDLQVITTDNAGNQTTSSAVTVLVDNTNPTQSIALSSLSPAGAAFKSGNTIFYRGTGVGGGSFQLTDTVSDAGSGPASAHFNPLGGTSTGWAHSDETISTPSGGPYTSTSPFAWSDGTSSSPTENVVGADGAGNTVPTTLTFTDDSTAPGGSITAPSANANIHGAAVTVSSDSSDGGSGVASAEFQFADHGGSNWTDIGTDNSAAGGWSVTWDTTTGVAEGLHDLRVITTDDVGNQTTSAPATVRVDNTSPTGSITAPSASSNVTGSAVTVSSDSADGGSGVASAEFQIADNGGSNWVDIGTDNSAVGGWSVTWDTTTGVAEGLHDLRVITADNAGNQTTSTPVTVRVDNTAPTGSITAPAASANVHGTIAVSSDSSDSGSGVASAQFQYKDHAGGSWTDIATDSSPAGGWSVNWNTASVPEGLYDLHVVTTDKVGLFTTSAAVTNVLVDNTSPANSISLSSVSPSGAAYKVGNTVYYMGTGGGSGGSFQLTDTITDPLSGPASASFGAMAGNSAGWSHTSQFVSSPPGGPFTSTNGFSWSEGASSSPTEDVVGADTAGNTATTTLTFTDDSTPPTGEITSPSDGAYLSGTINISSSTADAGSGVASAQFFYKLHSDSTWTPLATDTTAPYQTPWNTTGVPDGSYDLMVESTDKVGNVYDSAVVTVAVDNSVPTGEVTSPASGAAVAGIVPVSSNSADSGSSASSASFEYKLHSDSLWTPIDTDITAPFSVDWDTSGLSDGSYDLHVITLDGASNSYTSNTVTVLVDNTAPTGELTAPSGGDILHGTATVSSSSADAGSGVAHAVFEYTKHTGPDSWHQIADLTSGPYSTGWDTTSGVSDGLYDMRVKTTDLAGNQHISSVITVRVDNTPPSAPLLSFGSFTNASSTGSTVYYLPGVAGGFTVTASSTDAESGVASYSFPDLGAGWSVSGSGNSRDYSYTVSPNEPGAGQNVTATDAGGLTSAATPFSVVGDTTAPSTAITCNSGACAPWYTAAVTVGLSASDAGSGVADIRYTTDGSDPTESNGSVYSGPLQLPATATVKFRAWDAVGNEEAVRSRLISIDEVPPTGELTAPADGSNVSGTINLTSNSSDTGGSGVASAAFAYSPAGQGDWHPAGTASSSPYTVGWNTTGVADGDYDLQVTTTDVAGNAYTSNTITVTVDNIAPSGEITSPLPGELLSGSSATVTSNSADGGSGVASAEFDYSASGANDWHQAGTTTSGPYSVGWNTMAVSDGSYDLQVITTDRAGNTYTSSAVTVTVDNTAPEISFTAPTDGSFVSQSVSVSADAFDATSGVGGVTFEYQAAGASGWSLLGVDAAPPYSVDWDTTPGSDGPYNLRVTAVDQAGNTATPVTESVTVDNTSPSGEVTAPTTGSFLKGHVSVSSDSADTSGSGVATADFEYSPSGMDQWHAIGTATTGPFAADWNTATVADGSYDLQVVTTDEVGNSYTSNPVTVTVDNTLPTGELTAPAANAVVSGANVTVSSNSADAGSGIASVQFRIRPFGQVMFNNLGTALATGPYSLSWDTTSVVDGKYDLRVTTTDKAGNVHKSAIITVDVDNTPPSGEISSPANGADVSGTVNVATNSADAESGVASVEFLYKTSGSWTHIDTVPSSPYSTSWNTGALGDGTYHLQAITTDRAGLTYTSTPVTVTVDNTPPSVTLTAPNSTLYLKGTIGFTADATDAGGSSIASVAFQRSPAGGNSWTTIDTETTSPYAFNWHTTSGNDGLYDFRAEATDGAGNVTDSAPATSDRVDNTAPTGEITTPLGNSTVAGTSVPITTDSADTGGSGVTSVEFFYAHAGVGDWTSMGSVTSPPYTIPWNTTTFDDGQYDLMATTTDAAGNQYSSNVVSNVRVDNSAPHLTFGSFANAGASGDTVYFGAGESGNFTVTAAPSENVVVDHVDFPTLGTGWTGGGSVSSPPYAMTYTYDSTAVEPGAGKAVTVVDTLGGTSAPGYFTVSLDGTAPTASISCNGGSCAAGWYPSTVSVSLSGSDSESGLAEIRYTTDGSDPSLVNGTTYTGAFNVSSLTTVKYVAYDNVLNESTIGSQTIEVDPVPPTGEISAPADGTTVRGQVDVTSSSADTGGSGVASALFMYSVHGANSWNDIGSAVSSSPYEATWNTTALGSDGQYDLQVVTTDNAGNTYTSNVVTVTVDNTAPTASLTNPGSPLKNTVTLNATASDATSGVDTVTFEHSPHNQNAWTPIGADNSTPYSTNFDTHTVLDGSYDLRVSVTDLAGNTGYSSVLTVFVDNTDPTGQITFPAGGGVVTGTVSVTSDSADAGSGVASAEFQVSPAGAGSWTDISVPDTTSPFSASWNTVGDGLFDLRVTTTDKAGNVFTSGVVSNVRVDNTDPTGEITAPSSGAIVHGNSVTVSADSADTGGSGVASARFQYSPAGLGQWHDIATASAAPYSISWDTTARADGLYDVQVITTDNAGHQHTSNAVTNILIDNTAPTGQVTAPATNSAVHGTVAVSSDSADGSGSGVASAEFQYTDAGGNSWTTIDVATTAPYTVNWNTIPLTDGLFDLRVKTTDEAGNFFYSPRVSNVRVDNTLPTGQITAPGSGAVVRGPIDVTSNSADSGSGVASAKFEYSPSAGSSWTPIGTATSSPYTVQWDTAAAGDNQYNLRVTTTDKAGNQKTSALVLNVTVDNTAPSGGLTYPASSDAVRHTIDVTANSTDTGSGMASVAFEYRASGSLGSWTPLGTLGTAPYTVPWDTTTVPDGAYDVHAISTDVAGNQTTSTASNVQVDNTDPSGQVTAPTASAIVRNTVPLTALASDAGSGVASVQFEKFPAGGGSWTALGAPVTTAPFTLNLDTHSVPDGLWDLHAVVTDKAGNTFTSATVSGVRIDNTYPAGALTTPSTNDVIRGAAVTVSSNSSDVGGSGVQQVTFEYRAAGSLGSWSPIATDTTAPYTAPWDTTGVADGLYDVHATTSDLAGNVTIDTSTNVRIDNAAPTLSFGSFVNASVTGSTIYFQQGTGGSFSVTATPSGFGPVDHIGFPTLGAGWIGGGNVNSSPYTTTYTFNSGAGAPGAAQHVRLYDPSGDASPPANFSVVADSTAPSTSISCDGASCSTSWYTGTVSVGLSSFDPGSGVQEIRYTTDGSDPSPVNGTVYSGPFNVSAPTTVKYRAYDNVGNEESVGTQALQIDIDPPTGAISSPTSGQGFISGTVVGIGSNSADTGGSGVASAVFQSSPNGTGSWTTIGTDDTAPYAANWDTTSLALGFWDLRVITVDNAGHSVTSPVVTVQILPTSPPPALSLSLTKVKFSTKGKKAYFKTTEKLNDLARMRITLYRGKKVVFKWSSNEDAGRKALKLALAKSKLKKGKYKLVFLATASGGRKVQKSVTVKVPNLTPPPPKL
jgi:large repetitive protein